jgi:NADH:ubiquinone oxidoreductase subunit 2 (subunit N)
VLTSVVGLYYYLTVMKIIYRPGTDERPLPISPSWRVALIVCVAGILILGTVLPPCTAFLWRLPAGGSNFYP